MTKYKLVCFDVDGTLVDNVEFSWELLHDHFNIDKAKRKQAMEKYFKGEIGYKQWADHDIALWKAKGVCKQDFIDALKTIKLMKGALETIQTLKAKGFKLAIISGSIDIFLEQVLPNYKELFDDIFFSYAIFDKDEKLQSMKVTEFDMIKKADALKLISQRENIPLKQCVHIGDHHNDVEIAKIAGLSIAFNCKDEGLRKAATLEIKEKDLRLILPFILKK